MNKAVLENRFSNHARAAGDTHQHHELCLHVRRKTRVGLGFYVNADDSITPFNPDGVFTGHNLGAGKLQFMEASPYVLRFTTNQRDIPAGQCSGNHKGTRFNSIRNNSC